MSVSLYGSGQTILQVVQGNLTTSVSTSSSSFVTTGLSASITPLSTTSKILVMVSSGADNQASNGQLTVNLYRGATGLSGNGGFGVLYSGTARVQGFVSVVYLDSPSTTSSTTYTLYFASTNGGTVTFNNPNASTAQTGLITLLEVSGS